MFSLKTCFAKLAQGVVIPTLSALIFVTPINSYADAIHLPDLGAPDLSLYTPETEKEFGQAFVKSLHTEFTLNRDPEINDYIRQIGHKVAMHSGQNRDFSFYVIENDSINAFAGPNGVIGIHTGLIKAVKTEAELASVIAHEIAHITQQHLSRRYLYNSTSGTTTSVATLLAAILIGMVDPNAGMAALMGGQSLNIEKQLKNSRQHENEADFVGIKILYDSGYNAHAMADFFGRLADESRNNEFQVPEILRTHPVTTNRLINAENRANNLLPFIINQPSEQLSLIKIRLNQLDSQRNWKLKSQPTELSDNQNCYHLNILELVKNNSTTQHLKCLLKASNTEFSHPLYTNLLLERIVDLKIEATQSIDLAQYEKAALKMAQLHNSILTQRVATPILAATLIMTNNQSGKSIEWLKHNNVSKYRYSLENKLAEIYNDMGIQTLAYLHQAIAQQSIFNFKRSKHFMDEAKRINDQEKGQYTEEIEKFLTKYGDTFKKLSD